MYQFWITKSYFTQPEKWFFKVIEGFGRYIVVLEILFSVKCNRLRLDPSILEIDFISTEHNRDFATGFRYFFYARMSLELKRNSTLTYHTR